MEDLIYTLKQWRQLRGISQEKLAKMVGMSNRTIWNYENDINKIRNASYSKISKIANALEIKTGQIFLGNTSEKPKQYKGDINER